MRAKEVCSSECSQQRLGQGSGVSMSARALERRGRRD